MKIYNLQFIYKYYNDLEICQAKNYLLKVDSNYNCIKYN